MSCGSETEIGLSEYGNVINGRSQVCAILNIFYENKVGSANQEGPICGINSYEDFVGKFSNHPSVRCIKSNFVHVTFNFPIVTDCDIYQILMCTKGNKVTDYANKHANLLIVTAHRLIFSDLLKIAEVSPFSPVDKEKYRPIMLLTQQRY